VVDGQLEAGSPQNTIAEPGSAAAHLGNKQQEARSPEPALADCSAPAADSLEQLDPRVNTLPGSFTGLMFAALDQKENAAVPDSTLVLDQTAHAAEGSAKPDSGAREQAQRPRTDALNVLSIVAEKEQLQPSPDVEMQSARENGDSATAHPSMTAEDRMQDTDMLEADHPDLPQTNQSYIEPLDDSNGAQEAAEGQSMSAAATVGDRVSAGIAVASKGAGAPIPDVQPGSTAPGEQPNIVKGHSEEALDEQVTEEEKNGSAFDLA